MHEPLAGWEGSDACGMGVDGWLVAATDLCPGVLGERARAPCGVMTIDRPIQQLTTDSTHLGSRSSDIL